MIALIGVAAGIMVMAIIGLLSTWAENKEKDFEKGTKK